MRFFTFFFFFLSAAFNLRAQTVMVDVVDSADGSPVVGAVVKITETKVGGLTNAEGRIELPHGLLGVFHLEVYYVGYEDWMQPMSRELPLGEMAVIVRLKPVVEAEDIVIEGTRSNKTISDIPTRVEVLTEEIDEAATMDPSKVAHLLTHSTGIQVQTTSATSGTANVRIQGLDGRYTQILKDGFPLYGGLSSSLSIMQIPPLDLRQVEYIKGSASTLYGGGAISGLINLISKDPNEEETIIHLNGSHLGAFDVNAFMSRRSGPVGFTFLAQRNTHRYFDADGDHFSDLPQLTKYNLNPKLFFYRGERTKLSLGATITNEVRQGGDTRLLSGEMPDSTQFYKEKNETDRFTTQLKFDHRLSGPLSLTVRNSLNFFRRRLEVIAAPDLNAYQFSGRQFSSFSEVAFTHTHKKNVLIAGANWYGDRFDEDSLVAGPLRDEGYHTAGLFANYTAQLKEKLAVEAGLRTDYVIGGDVHLLPRLSLLMKWAPKLSSRIGGGLGYRNPSIFNQEAEALAYRQVMAIDYGTVKAEQSKGAQIDVGYKTLIGEHFFLNVNQMLFYARIDRPLVLVDSNAGGPGAEMRFVNANGYIQSVGGETFFKFGFYDFVFFAGYTFTQATRHFGDSVTVLPLTPVHSLKGDLLYALPGKWRIGADYEFKSAQTLSDGSRSPGYWTFGLVVERTVGMFTFFGNVENYTNVRQTKYGSLVSGPFQTPQFTEVWGPVDGIVVNVGLKVRLLKRMMPLVD